MALPFKYYTLVEIARHCLNKPQTPCFRYSGFLHLEFFELNIFRFSEVSDCGRYLITLPQQDCRDNLVFFTDLQALPDGAITGKLPLTQVIFKLEHDYEVRIQ